MNPNPFTLLAFAGAALLALSGCASTNETGRKAKQALVCPQCKMVVVTTSTRPYFTGHRYPYSYGSGATNFYKDTCPGCQGVIETLFKEGKWKHKCSVCKDSPYTCPVFHP